MADEHTTQRHIRFLNDSDEDITYLCNECNISRQGFVAAAVRLHLQDYAKRGMPVGTKRKERRKPFID